MISEIKIKKQKNLDFYGTERFYALWSEIEKINSITIITDQSVIDCLDSIFEVHRDIIFFIPNRKYSLIYGNYIIEKNFGEDITYLVFPIHEYKNKIKEENLH